MSLLINHVPPAYIDRLLNSPKSIRYRLPHLLEQARQDLLWGDTLAYQRTMQRVATLEKEIDRQDALLGALLEKALQAEQKKK